MSAFPIPGPGSPAGSTRKASVCATAAVPAELQLTEDLFVFDNKVTWRDEHRVMIRRSVALDSNVRRCFACNQVRARGLPGVVASPASHALYHPWAIRHLRRFAKTNLGSRMCRHVIKALRLEDGPQERAAGNAFSDGT